MQNLSLLIKPASGLCNMRCGYCFYHDLTEHHQAAPGRIMTEETADRVIEQAFAAAGRGVHFAFQGGEPTLAGPDFFRYFIRRADSLNPGLALSYSLQTNGLSLSPEFLDIFRQKQFLIGLSLDGVRGIHDRFRRDGAGQETFSRIMKTARNLEAAKIPFNILTVLSAPAARHIEGIYNALRRAGFRHLQFIPCLDPLDSPPFTHPHSLTPELYAQSLKRLFYLYHRDFLGGDATSIRFFDNLVLIARGQNPEMCGMLGYCPGQLVVESDGSVYPCDFYCTDGWKLGNIRETSFQQLFEGERMQTFIKTSAVVEDRCRSCPALPLCRGGCRRNRDLSSRGLPGPNVYCDALLDFYAYAAPLLRGLA